MASEPAAAGAGSRKALSAVTGSASSPPLPHREVQASARGHGGGGGAPGTGGWVLRGGGRPCWIGRGAVEWRYRDRGVSAEGVWFSAGILGRWAPLAARSTGLVARCCVRQVRAPAAAPLWRPRPLLWGSVPGGGTASVLSSVTSLLPSILHQPARTVTYTSIKRGKRKTVKAVIARFLRLHNGLWVRRQAGYKKKLWKKSASQRKRLRDFVLCTKTQCKLLDKMTTSFWKRRNWYVDDPYQKYHDRTNLRG
ncbi:large ribosomal subunit protein bL35m [Pezoporus flaviventris]|uniref:large ribosomal subunit protein bL35m n=1 Tax=Pezoporus flaviventris TaxID=889875 RepID=UPI002AB22A81|nr:large ribosomal subunit protein bL35m [Pezoporus flaviventris]